MSRKYQLLIYLCSFVLLSGCSLLITENSLYSMYGDYSAKLKASGDYTDKELDNLFNHFTPRYQTEVLNGREPSTEVIKHLIIHYFSTPLDLINTLSHYETNNKDNSCLLINTTNRKNERVSLYITYVNNNSWLIDNVNVEYLSEHEKYLKTPICDVEALMKKRVERWSQ